MEKSDPVKHFLRYLACEVSDLRSNGFVVNGTLWEVRCHRYYIYIYMHCARYMWCHVPQARFRLKGDLAFIAFASFFSPAGSRVGGNPYCNCSLNTAMVVENGT
jgi:hypothetical protein